MYIMYMALHINNPEVEQKVREMALLTGESMTEAIGRAADERIARARFAAGPQRTHGIFQEQSRCAGTLMGALGVCGSFLLNRAPFDCFG